MADRTRRLIVLSSLATAALAAVAVLETVSSEPAGAPPDFGPDAPARVVESAAPPSGEATRPPTGSNALRRNAPDRIEVPDVDLDARIEPVGVDGTGGVAVPDDPAVAGWYRFGPAPGGPHGSAVLVGHVDSETGDLGEFAALYDVEPGDEIEVGRQGAEPARYRVTARSTVPKDELPDSTFRRTGPPVLTLVTCAPPFVPDQGGYQANLVVTAEPLAG
ncbi:MULTISPECIES: class F sortase [unclassified Streptomyces]|uniref:class F sortase n=1 Tax=unclassified Streptomyces TaxID=2593676 RepID=UPI0022B60437|nr:MULTISPECIES: class F sortase [unclassified Streptomyces]MCZ7415875.1 class F sortase [Streptomyces sp. WMMC897]MCZ7434316.1 class F sortase [Streptomyces sp. WMMC1477]